MKKTKFIGTINGDDFSESYNNITEYNTRVTEFLDKGIAFKATTKTETVEVCEVCGKEDCICSEIPDDSTLFPYFISDSYYLDDLIASNISEKDIKTYLNSCNVLISNFLSNKNIDNNTKQEYFDKILDIRNMLLQDMKFNDSAITYLLEKRNEVLKTYNVAKEKYIKDIKQCDIEDNILCKASKFIELLKSFYDDIAKRATLVTCFDDNKYKGCTCTDECNGECNGECSCNSKECTCAKATFEEKEKPKVKDISELFNKIFGVNLNDLK